MRIFVEILTCNSRLSGHERKLRLNIVVSIELSFLSFQLFHDVAGSVSTGFPSDSTNDNISVRPTLLKRGTVIVSVVFTSFFDGLIGLKIVKVQTKQNSVIMGAECLRTIFAGHEKPNFIIFEFLPNTFHKKLEITLLQGQSWDGFSGLWVRVIGTRDVVIIISKRAEPSGIMIFEFEQTTVCPLPRVVNAASDTLTTGKWNKSGTRIPMVVPFNIRFTIIRGIAEHLQVSFSVFLSTNPDSVNRMITRHS